MTRKYRAFEIAFPQTPLWTMLALFEDLVFADDLADFLTIPAYELLTSQRARPITDEGDK